MKTEKRVNFFLNAKCGDNCFVWVLIARHLQKLTGFDVVWFPVEGKFLVVGYVVVPWKDAGVVRKR